MQGSRRKTRDLINAIVAAQLNHEAVDVVVCPPYVYLQEAQELSQNSKLQIGAQDVFYEEEGAFTGEISAKMLVDLNCRYVIIGHSERRRLLGESDELIARKVLAAYDAGLIPILCVGETLTEREAGQTMEVIRKQIFKVLEVVPLEAFRTALIAYEPVWAIGTGVAATPEQAEEVHAFIRRLFSEADETTANTIRILYGGSVKGDLALGLFTKTNIDGGLIGGASLNSEEFLTICNAAISRTVWNKFS